MRPHLSLPWAGRLNAHVIYCCSSHHSIGDPTHLSGCTTLIIHRCIHQVNYSHIQAWCTRLLIDYVLLIYAPPSIKRDICRDNHRCADRAYVSWASLVGGSLFWHRHHLYLDVADPNIYSTRRQSCWPHLNTAVSWQSDFLYIIASTLWGDRRSWRRGK